MFSYQHFIIPTRNTHPGWTQVKIMMRSEGLNWTKPEEGLTACLLPILEEKRAQTFVCWRILCKCNPSHCNPDFLIAELPASKGMPPLFSQPLKWASIKHPRMRLWTCPWLSLVLWSGFPCVLFPHTCPRYSRSWRLSRPDDVTVGDLKPPHGARVFLTTQAK